MAIVEEAREFVIELSYWFGFAVARQHPKDTVWYDEVAPRFDNLTARYCNERSARLTLRISASGLDFVNFGGLRKRNVAELGDMEHTDEFLKGVLVFEGVVQALLPEIQFLNRYNFCRSGMCDLTWPTIVYPVGLDDVYLCEGCENRFLLPPLSKPKVYKDNDLHEQERRKLTPALRWKILTRDNWVCRGCGRNPRKGDDIKLHVDHIKPVRWGGKTTEDNLQTLCQDCNLGKSSEYSEKIQLAFEIENLESKE